MEIDPRIEVAVAKVVDNQIENGDPPETAINYERLVRAGYTPVAAKNLIGCVVLAEVFTVLKSGKKYDHKRYVDALERLPQRPDAVI